MTTVAQWPRCHYPQNAKSLLRRDSDNSPTTIRKKDVEIGGKFAKTRPYGRTPDYGYCLVNCNPLPYCPAFTHQRKIPSGDLSSNGQGYARTLKAVRRRERRDVDIVGVPDDRHAKGSSIHPLGPAAGGLKGL